MIHRKHSHVRKTDVFKIEFVRRYYQQGTVTPKKSPQAAGREGVSDLGWEISGLQEKKRV